MMNPVCITNGGIWAGLNITPPCLCCVKSLRIRRMCDVAPRTTHGVVAHCCMPEHHAARHNVAASLGMTKAPRTCPPPTWFFCMSLMAICGGLSEGRGRWKVSVAILTNEGRVMPHLVLSQTLLALAAAASIDSAGEHRSAVRVCERQ